MPPRTASHPDEFTMSFGDHLEELRHRIILGFLPLVPVALIAYFFSNTLIGWLLLPLYGAYAANDLPARVQTLTPTEALVTQIKLSVIAAVIVGGPWLIWQLWLFVRPGLYHHERRFVNFLIPGSAVLTLAGVALMYFVMLPLMLVVLVAITNGMRVPERPSPARDARVDPVMASLETVPIRAAAPVDPRPGDAWLLWPALELHVAVAGASDAVDVVHVPRPGPGIVASDYRLSEYISFVLVLALAVAIAFQMPLVITLLGWLGLASPQWLKARRKYALFVCGVIAAIITPPDVISMLVLLGPLYGLYELGILLLRIAPARAVAEGEVLGRRRSGKGGRSADRPVQPVQAAGTLARARGGSESGAARADEEGQGR
jgi:sec-independent protein translocase protein TatC